MVRNKHGPQKRDETSGNLRANEYLLVFKRKRKPRVRRVPEKMKACTLLPYEDHQNEYYLGDLRLGITNNVVPEKVFTWKVSFKSCNTEHPVITLNSNDKYVFIKAHDDVSFFNDLVQSKVFTFDVYSQEEYVYVKVFFLEVPLPKCTPKISQTVQKAFQTFYNVHIQGLLTENENKISYEDELGGLYHELMDRRKSVELPPLESKHLKFLKPSLRPYQEQAVRWMMDRENRVTTCGQVHPLYQKITLKSGCDIYLDKWNGWIEKDPPVVQSCWKGGILADEMGLGKTVEVLGLILTNYCKTEIKLEPSEDQLVIQYETKKRKLPKDGKIEPVQKKEKLTNTPPDISEKMKPGGTFKALEAIYNHTLSKYSTVKKQLPSTKKQIQCVCGSGRETGCVDCVDCGKIQHSSCLGWTSSLGPYHCPQCWQKIDPIETKATLIVAPIALRRQWCREMRTHLRAGLKVLNYEGYSTTPVYPTALQHYDIVITTYNVLQAEMRLTETGQSLQLRHQRKYWPGGSALVRVMWWRLCLDEAQTVETPGCIVSLMAGKIPAKHRWAVTGTPMAKGLSDIFGLIDYLKMEPYSDFDTWKHILYDPYIQGTTEPMLSFLSEVLWRTSKSSVLDQINIPPQTEELHLLEFSAVEKFFYQREHEICAGNFLHTASKFEADLPLEKINKRDLKKLLGPLLALRQACSDPSAVSGKGRYLCMKKDVSSMKDLLDALILKNKNDCEESLRLMISSINGLAGIYLLMEDSEQAVKEYRKVLQLAAKFSSAEKEEKLVVDKLPLIHAMYNLGEILTTYTPQERTLRDDTLFEDCAKLEKQYIEKFMKESASAIETLTSITTTVDNYQNQMVLKYGQWYSDGFDWVSINNLEDDFTTRVEAAATKVNLDLDIRLETVTTRSLLRQLHYYHTNLEQSRLKLHEAIKNLYFEDPESKHVLIVEGLVEKAMDCHLRPQKTKGKKKATKCLVCIADDHLKNYEMELYTMKKRTQHFEDMALEGSWKVRFEELLIKGLLGLMKSKNSAPELLVKDGETHVMTLETMKKEFKEIRKVWTVLDRQICSQDEISICKVRLQLKNEDDGDSSFSKGTVNRTLKNLSYEQKATHDFINLIMPAELPYQELKMRSDENSQNSRLESLLGTRNYLDTLRRQQYEGSNPDPCPVCQCPLTNTWVILTCAHTLCLDCFQILLNRSNLLKTEIQCCVCRSKQKLEDVAYIHAGKTSEDTVNDDTFVAGNYSRKVESVVRLLLNLRKNDSDVKVLLFSTWPQVLKLLKKALEQNNIKAELAEANVYFQPTIETFKDPLKKVTALLLPITLGAKGLNLIEATHVVLLEPLLNPADELQAIGRVHRIGQTRKTVVHKFLIRNTVEESLHNATSSNAAGWEKGRVTIGDLKELFKSVSEETSSTRETNHCQV